MVVLRTKCPLTPLCRSGQATPGPRITPESSTDVAQTIQTLGPEVVSRFPAGRGTCAIVSPIASYSPTHVMVMNVDPDRYLPGPDMLDPAEGDMMSRVAGQVLEFLGRRCDAETGHAGFNWSEFSWGAGLEEHGGFASMPTKFHEHVWTRAAAPEEGLIAVFNESKTEWLSEKELAPHLYRLLIKNDYGVPLGKLFAAAAREALARGWRRHGALGAALTEPANWSFDARGACAAIALPLLQVAGYPRLFSGVIQPVANSVIRLLNLLTETFTDMNCIQLRGILTKVESDPLSATDLADLRAVPHVRPEGEIRSALNARGLPAELADVLLPPIRERCQGATTSDPYQMWRKGFGFALCFSGPIEGCACELRLMPGVYLGPGGVVEAQGIVLSRVPVAAPHGELLRRSRVMLQLGRAVVA